jgi:hypothetical protein
MSQGSRKLEPWAEISQRLRRIFQTESIRKGREYEIPA